MQTTSLPLPEALRPASSSDTTWLIKHISSRSMQNTEARNEKTHKDTDNFLVTVWRTG
jgi:hypothetical protein